MFSQLFGKYLVDHEVISQDTLTDILKEQNNARVKLGTIAVADGMLTEKQAEEINHLQTQMDKRFGDIAVEQKYLTDEQVSLLLKKQGNVAMKFYQLLTDKGGLTLTDIDKNLSDFQSANGFTDGELEALKEENIDKLIPLFAATMNPLVTGLAGLVLRNITRFVTTDFYPGRMHKVKDYEYTVLAGQVSRGDKFLYLGFAADSSMDGIIELANGFAHGTSISGSDEIYDAVSEFANLNNGLFASESSKTGLNIDMLPPVVYLNQKISGTAYTMPVYIHDRQVDIIISVDENMIPGKDSYMVELKKNEDTEAAASSKGRIMIVDDSSLIRKMLRGLLEKNGYTVVAEAVNGAEAVEMYDMIQPDVVTLDITMPVMDGVEALKQIKAKDSKANVIMITAAGQQDKVVEALKSGANLFIMKPFNEEDVIKNFENILK